MSDLRLLFQAALKTGLQAPKSLLTTITLADPYQERKLQQALPDTATSYELPLEGKADSSPPFGSSE